MRRIQLRYAAENDGFEQIEKQCYSVGEWGEIGCHGAAQADASYTGYVGHPDRHMGARQGRYVAGGENQRADIC